MFGGEGTAQMRCALFDSRFAAALVLSWTCIAATEAGALVVFSSFTSSVIQQSCRLLFSSNWCRVEFAW